MVLTLLVSQLFPLHLHVHNHNENHFHEQPVADSHIDYKHADYDADYPHDATVIDLNKSSLVLKKSNQATDYDLLPLVLYLFTLLLLTLVQVVSPVRQLLKPGFLCYFLRPPLRAPPVIVV